MMILVGDFTRMNGNFNDDARAFARPGIEFDCSSERAHAFADAPQPETCRHGLVRSEVKAAAIVLDERAQQVRPALANGDAGLGCFRIVHRGGQTFLYDAIKVKLRLAGKDAVEFGYIDMEFN